MLAERRHARPGEHRHDAFEVQEIEVAPGSSEAEVLSLVEGLDALRVKGFVVTDAGPRVVQGVGPRIELSGVASPPPASLLGRLVVIRRAP